MFRAPDFMLTSSRKKTRFMAFFFLLKNSTGSTTDTEQHQMDKSSQYRSVPWTRRGQMPNPLLDQARQWGTPLLQLGVGRGLGSPCSLVLEWPPCFDRQPAAWEKVCEGLGNAWMQVQLSSGRSTCPACWLSPRNLA